MKISPQSRQEWLAFALLPFKAYTILAPLLFVVSATLLARPPHTGAADAEVLLVLGLLPCSAILLTAAAVFALVGPKGTALPCAGFGAAAFIIGWGLVRYL
jgi:hypothetical protein